MAELELDESILVLAQGGEVGVGKMAPFSLSDRGCYCFLRPVELELELDLELELEEAGRRRPPEGSRDA